MCCVHTNNTNNTNTKARAFRYIHLMAFASQNSSSCVNDVRDISMVALSVRRSHNVLLNTPDNVGEFIEEVDRVQFMQI